MKSKITTSLFPEKTSGRRALIPAEKTLLLGLFLFFLCGSGFQCFAPQKTGGEGEAPTAEEMTETEPDSTPSVYSETLSLSSEAIAKVDEISRGVKGRGVGECLILYVGGVRTEGASFVDLHVFLNKTDIDTKRDLDSPHFVATVGLNVSSDPESTSNYVFDLDRAVEELGEDLRTQLEQGILQVTLVAEAYSPETKGFKPVPLFVEELRLEVSCE